MNRSMQFCELVYFHRYSILVKENETLLARLQATGVDVSEFAATQKRADLDRSEAHRMTSMQASNEQDSSFGGFLDWKLHIGILYGLLHCYMQMSVRFVENK